MEQDDKGLLAGFGSPQAPLTR